MKNFLKRIFLPKLDVKPNVEDSKVEIFDPLLISLIEKSKEKKIKWELINNYELCTGFSATTIVNNCSIVIYISFPTDHISVTIVKDEEDIPINIKNSSKSLLFELGKIVEENLKENFNNNLNISVASLIRDLNSL